MIKIIVNKRNNQDIAAAEILRKIMKVARYIGCLE
jgi:hypothetical protein